MKLKEAERILDAFLARLTSPLGFSRVNSLDFASQRNEAIGQLTFPCRVDARGFTAFTCHVGVRFESIAQWLDQDRPETVSTLATPIYFLREQQDFTEWQFAEPDDLEGLWGRVFNDVKNLALPFIDTYSHLDEIQRRLESPNPRDWFVLGPERRVNVLAMIKFIQGDKTGSIKILDEALVERKTALPKYRFEIEYLRKRLITETQSSAVLE